jgi:Domain of unknown function (DUF4118)
MKSDDLIHAGRAVADTGGITIGMTIGAPAAIAVGASLTTVRWAVNSVNTALIFMVLVVAVAALGGRAAGAITAVASVMAYDFFLTEPYLSMAIESRDDVETTVLLLVAGLLVGTIATKGRSARHREAATRVEVRRVHRVAEAAATGRPPTAVLEVARDEITAVLDLADCWFEPVPYPNDLLRPRLGRNGAIQAQSSFRFRRHRDGRAGFELPREGVEVQVLARGRHVGRFILVPNSNTATTVDDRLITVTIADQVGAAWPIPPDVPQSATG